MNFLHNDLFFGIMSRREVNEFIYKTNIDFSNVVLISILDPFKDSSKNNQSLPDKFIYKFKDTITTRFWDVEKEIGEYKPISSEIAIRLANFIRIYTKINCKFLIHCNAGISRSAGVGMAVRCIKQFNGNKYLFHTAWKCEIKEHRRYSPNMYVFDKIVDEYNILKNTNNTNLFLEDYIKQRSKL